MPRIVKDDGTGRERIVIIGEMPAREEEALGKPFVGPSGQVLMRWLRLVGLERRDCYWTNVVPYRHNQKNDIKQVPLHEIAHYTQELHQRLASLHDPVVIVPTGNTALRALAGKWGITKHRGSIYAYRDGAGRIVKVIPTIHPSAIFKMPGWERRCLADWRRIAGDSDFRDLRLPEREHFIRPTLNDCEAYLADAQERAEILVTDLETPRKLIIEPWTNKKGVVKYRRLKGPRRVTCAGFSFDPFFSITIPTTEEYWGSPEAVAEAWGVIAKLCALPIPIGGQNAAGFDAWWYAQHGIYLPILYDSRWMSHANDPLDSHDLAYQASIHTREPYWKDDHKGESKDEGFEPPDLDTYWRYNGKDCCVTHELISIHLERLGPRLAWYLKHYPSCFASMLAMSVGGMAMDDKRRRSKAALYLAESIGIQEQLTALAGEPIYGPKGSLSFKKLATYLYQNLRLPEQHNRATGGITTREVAVRQLMIRFPAKLGKDGEKDKPGPLILRHRRLEALRRFVKEGIVDEDGRARSQFGWVNTMRFRAGKNPMGTGNNSQNTDRELLDLYIPNPGDIFLEVDLSQAEDRVVKMLTKSPRLIERARAMPWDNDEHKRAAVIVFPAAGYKTWEDVPTKGPHRYIGKRTRHAGNYGLRGKTFSEALLKEGIVITPDEGNRMINTLLDVDTPEVRDWQRGVRQTVLRTKTMVNSWGLIWDLSHERLNDDLFRSCYSMVPQSEVVTILNQWGLVPLYDYIEERQIPAQISNQKHDSVLISTPPEFAWELACFLKASLERPRTYAGNELVIPCEFKLGKTAAGEHEFKRFPSKNAFNEVAFAFAERAA